MLLCAYRYELSQDLIEKQVELLERKYGGSQARKAANVIQRAFRHYMLVKKFAHITAMAKAEKRLSKRLEDTQSLRSHDSQLSVRSGSLREKRLGYSPTKCNSLPRSRSGRCDLNYYGLESTYSHLFTHNNYNYNDMIANPEVSEQLFLQKNISSQMAHHLFQNSHNCNSCNHYSSSCCMYSSENSTGYQSNISKNKVPPEVPKRTSSISYRSLREQHNNFETDTLNKLPDNFSLSSIQSSNSSECSSSSQKLIMDQTCSSVDCSYTSNSIGSWNNKSQVSYLLYN